MRHRSGSKHPSGPRDAGLPGRRRRLLVSVTIGAVLVGIALLVELWGLLANVHGERLTMLGLALVTMLIAAAPLVLDQSRPPFRRHLVMGLFAVAFLVSYGVPVFTNYFFAGPIAKPGNIGPPLWPNPGDIVRGQEVALLSLVCMLVAYALPIWRPLGRIIPAPSRDWSPAECDLVAVGMLGIGYAVVGLSLVGVLPRTLGSGVITTLASFHMLAVVVLTYSFLRYRSPTSLLILAVSLPISTLLGFVTGSKRLALTPVALVVLTTMLVSGKIRVRWLVLGVVGLSLFYPTAMFYRYVILNNDTLPVTVPLRDPVGTMKRVQKFIASQKIEDTFAEGIQATGSRLDALGVTSVIVRDTPRVSPFQDGRTLVYFFYGFFPRLIWTNKPDLNIGQWITDTYGPGPIVRSQTGPTIAGDLYLNFGLPAVVIGFLVLGALIRIFHEALLARVRYAPAVLLTAVLTIRLATFLQANVAGALAGVIFALVPIAAIHLLVTTFVSPRRASGRSSRVSEATLGGGPSR